MNLLAKQTLTLQANAFAPQNTQNFFGSGNETQIDKFSGYKKYYRTRFNLYTLILRYAGPLMHARL